MSPVLSRTTTPSAGTVARSAAATAEVVALTAVAHTWADGSVPSPGPLLALAAGVFGTALLVLDARARTWQVVPVVAALQVGLHTAFALLQEPAVGHHAVASGDLSHHLLSPAMLTAHAVSVVLTVLVLALQEQAIERLARLLALADPSAPVASAPRFVVPASAPRRRGVLLTVSPRRGPPGLLAPAP